MRYNDRLREKQEMRHDLDQKNEAEEHDTGESEHFGIPPITYGELFEQVRTRRSRELEEERPGHRNNSNAISNTSRSLTAFMDVNELCKSDLVGPELYEMNLAEKTIQKIGTNATARRRRSEMNKRVRPWAIELIRVRQHPFHNESFGQRLRRLREEAGLSQSQLSKEGQRGGRLGPNIASWELERAYPSVASVEIVKRLEDVLQVPRGYLVGKLAKTPPFSMSFETGLPKSIQRRVAQHLPADFNVRSDDEKDQILAWVAENILSTPKEVLDDGDETQGGCHDLSFYSLSRKPSERLMMAPEGLLSEIDEIRKYKTTELLPMGLQRNEKWGPVSADKADYELRAFMGALVKMGLPLSQASLTAALSPTIIDRFIEWRRDRRGGYTRAIEKPLLHIASFVHPKFGFLTQRTNFGRPQEPVAGLLTKDEAHIISHDRRGACEAVHRHVTDRIKELAKVTKDTKGRDPFEAILPVLEADEPWMEYHKIAREIRSRMPDDTYPVRKAEALRAIAMFRLNTQIGLRSKNWREMLFGERNNPRSWKELRRLKRGEIVFLDEVGWVIRIRREALKNASASHLTPTIQIKVLDIDGLHAEIERYISARPILLGEKKDPGVFFVKTRNSRSTSSEYNQAGFYNVWRAIITTYGIYNPWTDRGAIKGLRPHGPHAARHIIATDSVKDTGGFSDAARLLFDTEEMIRDNYARFLPGDAHARAQQRLLDRMVSRRTNGDIA